MCINQRGIQALQKLRIDLQETAGIEFPHAFVKELLILYDVCKYLELPIFQTREILGVHGFAYVTKYINGPVHVNLETISCVLEVHKPA
ncbi:MAG: hypothetical protein R3E39_06385 [Anaerolineae bacterium]